MKITIRIDKNYGIETAYPACAQSRLLADLAGTKTLTPRALDTIIALGYQITLAQGETRNQGDRIMLIAYHARHEINGWHHVCTHPDDSPEWSAQHREFINTLHKTGEMVLVCGWNMWQIVKETRS